MTDDEIPKGELEDALAEVSQSFAEEKDKILYEACEDGAEAVVFTHQPVYEGEMEREDGSTFTVTQRYKVCEKIEEVNGMLDLFDTVAVFEIPVYAERLAGEADSLREFQEKMKEYCSRWKD